MSEGVTTHPVTTRPVTAADETRWRELWAGYQAFYGIDLAESSTAELFRRLLDEAEPYGGFLAEREGEVVGMTNYVLIPDTWDPKPNCYLNDLFVDPQARGTGAGHALVAAVKARAQELDCPLLWWLTAEDNSTAQALYDQIAERDSFRRYEVLLRKVT